MKTLAVLFSLLGVMAMVTPNTEIQTTKLKSESIAVNFAVYRNAVNSFATGNVTIASGEVPDSYLDLPSGWRPVRTWSNRMDSGNCYVWGPIKGDDGDQIKKLFANSYAIGTKRSGFLVNAHGTGIALPSYIPENSIVSVITP